MDTKTNKALNYYKGGAKKKAFELFRSFTIGFSKREHEYIVMAYECLAGYSKFYEAIGYRVDEVVEEACKILESKYNIKSN